MNWFSKAGLTAWLRYLGVAAVLVVGGVHLQQYYAYGIRYLPTVGPLFLLNAAGAVLIAVMLVAPFRLTRILGALGGVGFGISSIVALMIARTPHGLFGYVEVTWRTAIVIAVVAEAATAILLGAYLIVTLRRRERRQPTHRIRVARPSRAAS